VTGRRARRATRKRERIRHGQARAAGTVTVTSHWQPEPEAAGRQLFPSPADSDVTPGRPGTRSRSLRLVTRMQNGTATVAGRAHDPQVEMREVTEPAGPGQKPLRVSTAALAECRIPTGHAGPPVRVTLDPYGAQPGMAVEPCIAYLFQLSSFGFGISGLIPSHQIASPSAPWPLESMHPILNL
jgi:hypothetical protein